MKFGAVPVADAEGSVAVHSIRQSGLVLKKGTLIGKVEIAALKAAGITEIVVARIEPGDVSEDEAAAEIAAAVAGEGLHVERAFTGRANLFAETAGVLVVDKDAIDRLNQVDESITFATLPAYKPVVAGEMIATVKIIPFAVAGKARDAALAVANAARPLVRIAPYRIRKIGVVSTLLPGLAAKVIEKTLKVTEERLAPAGAGIVAERRVAHEQGALAAAIEEVLGEGAELVIVFGASAIADRRDVIPAAVAAIGGRIEHFGMPVDPGNLLLIASARDRPVIGAPGCARSPKENGFDWVLMRLLAGLDVPRAAITGMGVGGLLMEIVTRPQPRAEPPAVQRAWADRTSCSPRSRAGRLCASWSRRRWRRAPIRSSSWWDTSAQRSRRRSRGYRSSSFTIRTLPRGWARRCALASPPCRRTLTARSSAWETCRRSMRA